jgi:hypothetical protein
MSVISLLQLLSIFHHLLLIFLFRYYFTYSVILSKKVENLKKKYLYKYKNPMSVISLLQLL